MSSCHIETFLSRPVVSGIDGTRPDDIRETLLHSLGPKIPGFNLVCKSFPAASACCRYRNVSGNVLEEEVWPGEGVMPGVAVCPWLT
ncbi:MAG: hypothetical protein ACYS8Z_10550, partial [Planctomycetota bacterium]